MKALAKNPMNRYQSAGEMRTDLLRALADRPVEAEAVLTDAERTQYISKVPPGAVPPGAVVPMSADGDDEDDGEGRRRAWLWAALVAALLLVIGGGAWAIWALSGSDSPTKAAVPNVIGMNPAQANAAIASRKFTPPTGTPQVASKCGVNPDTQPIASPDRGHRMHPVAPAELPAERGHHDHVHGLQGADGAGTQRLGEAVRRREQ